MDKDASGLFGFVAGAALLERRLHIGLLRAAVFVVCKVGWGRGPLGHGGKVERGLKREKGKYNRCRPQHSV